MLTNDLMAQIRRHADNRKEKIAKNYARVVKGPGDSPALQGAANAGIDLAVEKLATGGISNLNTIVDQHETTDKLWRTALRSGQRVTIADRPVKIGQFVQHEVQLREMKLMLKFARRIERMAERKLAARKETAEIISLAQRNRRRAAAPEPA